jgi:lysophospholipase L1-like esterase
MSNENQINKPVVLLLLTVLFLLLLQFIPAHIKFLNYETKKFDLFMDIKPDSLLLQGSLDNKSETVNPALALPQVLKGGLDKDLITAFTEKISNFNPLALNNPAVESGVGLSGNLSNLSYFIQALKNSKTTKVRIAHYGDSEIEGDFITADIRQNFQSQYGGNGVGLLSITSQDITFRTITTKQDFSSDWKTGSVVFGNSSKLPISITGSTSTPDEKSWVSFETAPYYSTVKSFKVARVFYTNAKSSSVKYSFNGGSDQSASLQTGSNVKELVLKANGDAKKFELVATMKDQADFLGVSLESDNGVYVDNFPLRGNSGVSIKDIPQNILTDFNNMLSYKLIILQFGLNIISSGQKDYSWYEREMTKVVEYLKTAFPKTSIVLIGVGDKSVKAGSKFITDPNVLKLVDIQKSIADKTGIVFWNLYEAMGGNNSMNTWVNANPPLATKDYTHFTTDGAKKVANMFFDALMEQYKKAK